MYRSDIQSIRYIIKMQKQTYIFLINSCYVLIINYIIEIKKYLTFDIN